MKQYLAVIVFLSIYSQFSSKSIYSDQSEGFIETDQSDSLINQNHHPIGLIASLSIALLICLVIFIVFCSWCRDVSAPRRTSHGQYQENMDPPVGENLPGASIYEHNDRIIIEPLPDFLGSGSSAANSRRSRDREKRQGKPMDYNHVINRGLVDKDWFSGEKLSTVSRNNIKFVKELGNGWFGHVVEGESSKLVENVKNAKLVVQILNTDLSSMEKAYVMTSAKKYRDLRHYNIIKLITVCLESQPYLLIYENFIKNDLKQYLHKNRANCDQFLENGSLIKYILNVADGLTYLHEHNFILNDLACRNCYITPNNVVTLGDYGISSDLHKGDYVLLGDIALPLRWVAPETISVDPRHSVVTKEIDKRANIWTIGVVFWEILEFGKLPYFSMTNDWVLEKVVRDRCEILPEPLVPIRFRDKCYQIMQMCFKFDPDSRPSIFDVQKMLRFIDRNYQLAIKQQILEEDFENKWRNVTISSDSLTASSPVPTDPVTTPPNLHNSIPSAIKQQNFDSTTQSGPNLDDLEKIDKRNFILTLENQELCKLADEEIRNFYEFLTEKEIAYLENRRLSARNEENLHKNDENSHKNGENSENVDGNQRNSELEAKLRQISTENFQNLTPDDLKLARNSMKIDEFAQMQQRLFEFLHEKLSDRSITVENQWLLIDRYIDFLNLPDQQRIKVRFEQNAKNSSSSTAKKSPIEAEKSNFAEKNEEKRQTDTPDQSEIFKSTDHVTSSTPIPVTKKEKTVQRTIEPLEPLGSADKFSYPSTRQNPSTAAGLTNNSTPLQNAAARDYERMRRQISQLSDQQLAHVTSGQLEQDYFGYMSPDEILALIQRKQRVDSLSSSFFKRQVPSADRTDPPSSADHLTDSLFKFDSPLIDHSSPAAAAENHQSESSAKIQSPVAPPPPTAGAPTAAAPATLKSERVEIDTSLSHDMPAEDNKISHAIPEPEDKFSTTADDLNQFYETMEQQAPFKDFLKIAPNLSILSADSTTSGSPAAKTGGTGWLNRIEQPVIKSDEQEQDSDWSKNVDPSSAADMHQSTPTDDNDLIGLVDNNGRSANHRRDSKNATASASSTASSPPIFATLLLSPPTSGSNNQSDSTSNISAGTEFLDARQNNDNSSSYLTASEAFEEDSEGQRSQQQ